MVLRVVDGCRDEVGLRVVVGLCVEIVVLRVEVVVLLAVVGRLVVVVGAV